MVFTFLAFGWLVKELTDHRPGIMFLERFGAASYSFYLLHPIVLSCLDQFILLLSPAANLAVKVAAVALSSSVFYLVIEAPSHRLARAAACSRFVQGMRLKIVLRRTRS